MLPYKDRKTLKKIWLTNNFKFFLYFKLTIVISFKYLLFCSNYTKSYISSRIFRGAIFFFLIQQQWGKQNVAGFFSEATEEAITRVFSLLIDCPNQAGMSKWNVPTSRRLTLSIRDQISLFNFANKAFYNRDFQFKNLCN